MKLAENLGTIVAQLEHVSGIGSLTYVMYCTTSDIAYVLSKQPRFASRTGTMHWKTITSVLGCIMGTTVHYFLENVGSYLDAS